MTIEFHCPHCEKLLRTADSKAGLSASCPQCGQPVTVPAAPAPGDEGAADEAWAESGAEAVGPPSPASSAGTSQSAKRPTAFCPTCGEPTKDEWVVCGFCGEPLDRGFGGGPRPPGEPRPLEIGSILSRAWTLYGRQLGLCVGSFFIALAIYVGVYILCYALAIGALFAVGPPGGNNVGAMAGFFGIFGVVYIAVMTLISWLMLGFFTIMLRVARGDQSELTELFRGGRHLLRWLGVVLIGTLVSILIQGVLILPAIGMGAMRGAGPMNDTATAALLLGYLAGMVVNYLIFLVYWPTPWLIIDRDLGPLEALGQAPSVSKGSRGTMFVVSILSGMLFVGGYVACCVGLIFTAPLAALMFAIAYCDATGQFTARV